MQAQEVRGLTIYVVTLLSLLVSSSSRHLSPAHDDNRNQGGGGTRLIANVFHRKPITSIETETSTTHPKPRQQHDVDAGIIFIHDHDRKQRSTTSPSNYLIQNCSHSTHSHYQKKKMKGIVWWRPLTLKHQRQLVRKAYRMAVLASLAYHDFRDNSMHHDASHPHRNSTRDAKNNISSSSSSRIGSTWTFSLIDDPPPVPYLSGRQGSETDGNNSVRRKTRKHAKAAQFISGMVARVQVSICRIQSEFATSKRQRNSKKQRTDGAIITDRCKYNVLKKQEGGKRYNIKYILSDWHEEKAKIRWHDTDLIIATSGSSELVIAFAGTASPADAVTNIQTLEPISHSGFFYTGGREGEEKLTPDSNATAKISSSSSSSLFLEGNIHRGYLNAYARVIRGQIRKLDDDMGNGSWSSSMLTMPLDDYFNTCIMKQQVRNTSKHFSNEIAIDATINRNIQHNITKKDKKRWKKNRYPDGTTTCRSIGYSLLDLLRNVTTRALQSGHTVHVVGHSLAGALATIHALDIAMNHVSTPIHQFHLWTFGAPEVADSLFFESAGAYSFRMRDFFSDASRYHRYVTQSVTNCEVTDVVASIASKSLNRRAVRRLGGVRGNVIHTIDPLYLPVNGTTSGVELHELRSYLSGLLFSSHGVLSTDFSLQMKNWLGEST